ncbi:MAG: hypothetical protein E7214_03910 [Clostridium sp.]|nr:hypothetical protein [Clostridium sp.]
MYIMKIGVITDIHNNIEALNAVLDKFFSLGIRKIICSGDIIGIGPRPEETVKKIMPLRDSIECVRGNHDNYLINGIPNIVPLGCPGESINIARAGVINISNENIISEELNVTYDIKKVIEDIEDTQYPDFKNILKYFYGIS